jgi:hypothetical protein
MEEQAAGNFKSGQTGMSKEAIFVTIKQIDIER